MLEIFEKLLERLEEEKENSYADFEKYANENGLDEDYDDFFSKGIERAMRVIREEARHYGGGWIPCSERYPDTDKYILLSFSNFSVPEIGRWEQDEEGGAFYIGDEEESCSSQYLFVNAWQYLPAPYYEEGEDGE